MGGRWNCKQCLRHKSVLRVGEANDGRPKYQCQVCRTWYTEGYRGEPDDPEGGTVDARTTDS